MGFFLILAWFQNNAEETLGFPVNPTLLVQGFKGCEGIAFNGKGHLFVTANKALWRIERDGSKHHLVDLDSNLGLAAIGERDLLVADFGPTNAFRQDRNADGVIWRVTPDGEKTAVVRGIGDPNFILVLKDGRFLVSDDATNEIFIADLAGNLNLFCTAVNHPNGLAIAPDGKTLYVAQIFQSIRPVVPDNRVWSVRLSDGKPMAGAREATRTGPGAANDGLGMDRKGRVYITANNAGQIWRFNPDLEAMVLIAEGMFGAASIAFGEGEFDHQAIYVTTTFAGGRGGKVFEVKVGVEGLLPDR